MTSPLKEAQDEFHRHELLDRIHCVRVIIEDIIGKHPSSRLVKNELKAVDNSMHALYQAAARARFR